MIILESKLESVSQRALSLFATRARRAVRLKGEVSILITSNKRIQELNRRFRRKDKPTDVLSFPSNFDRFSGDIAISADIAKANGARLGHGTTAELKILMLHGILHLAGFDHETDDGEMERKELRLRSQLGLPEGLIERTIDGTKAPVKKSGKSRGSAVDSASRRRKR